jgi:hypothetical protein
VIWGCIQRQAAPAASGGSQAGSEAAAADDGAPVEPSVALPPGTPLVAGLEPFTVQGEGKNKVEVKKVPAQGQPFKEALELKINEASNSEWTVQIQAPTAAPVAKGDVILATFYVRATRMQEDGTAETQFVFEKAGPPYTKSVTHSLGVGEEWRQVRVRFMAGDDFAAGGAQMIFRLGYEPETIEVGGLTVENYKKAVALSSLPSTQGRDRKKPGKAEPPVEVKDGGVLAFTVTPNKVVTAISPYVYGINSQKPADTGTTVRRMGGNRQTVYNWESNASNAGNDWNHTSDDWSCSNLGYKDCDVPGAQFVDFIAENKQSGIESLVTIPIIDWTTADKKGSVKENEKPPSKRFHRSLPRKPGAPPATKPDLKDDVVYQDGFVALLVEKFGKASAGGARFYSLDNEPALWPTTHPRVHGQPTTYGEIMARTEATASMITEIDPTATVLGAIAFGWDEFTTLSSAPDAETYKSYGTYLDYFLASSKKLEDKYRRRLVHVLDVHWYPEVKGKKRITEQDNAQKTIDARVAAPRSLWDPTYQEKSWIGDKWGKPIRLFPWLKELVAKNYPGTKLSMTEYNYGSGDHISGGIAQADVLGIFGREGVYLANYWGNAAGVGELPKYITAAFKLYRNYDGKGGQFGDTAVTASTDIEKASIYAATDSKKPGRLTLVVLNKDQRHNYQASIKIAGAAACTSAKAYRFDSSSADLRAIEAAPVKAGEITANLPALSATLFVCEKG